MTWTYSDLKTKVGAYLGRTDLSSQIDDGIMLFESEYNSRRSIWRKQAVASIATVAETTTANLPNDYETMVSLERVGYPGRIQVTTVEGIKAYRVGAGEPDKAAVYPGDKLIFAPTPDAAYTYEMIYNARLDGLDGSTSTNWLIEKYPHIYLYGVLFHMLEYVQDEQRKQSILLTHERGMSYLESAGGLLPEHDFVMNAEQSMP